MSDTTDRLARLRAELAGIIEYIAVREARGKNAHDAHDDRRRVEAEIRGLTEAHARAAPGPRATVYEAAAVYRLAFDDVNRRGLAGIFGPDMDRAREFRLTDTHAANCETALRAIATALSTATAGGRRTDCLNAAYDAMAGALRNVEWEDAGRPEER